MMNSNRTIHALNEIINNLTLYVPHFIITIGTLSSLLNLLTFTSKQLINNPCALYFSISSIFDLFYLYCSTLIRLINDHYPYILPHRSSLFCKIRIYLSVTTPSIATFFIALVAIDRCLKTSYSNKWRHLSHIKIARWISIYSLIFWATAYFHVPIYFELRIGNINNDIFLCLPKPGIYTSFVGIYFLVCNTILMYSIMLTASIVTLVHIRNSRNRRQMRTLRVQKNKFRRIDRHLITIMFFQVGIGILLTGFRCIFLAYSFLTDDSYQISIRMFFDRLTILFYYLNFTKSFAVNTLTSPLFRDIFCQRLITIWKTVIKH